MSKRAANQRVAQLREQPKRVAAALAGRTVREAAAKLGIAERTLYKLLAELRL